MVTELLLWRDDIFELHLQWRILVIDAPHDGMLGRIFWMDLVLPE